MIIFSSFQTLQNILISLWQQVAMVTGHMYTLANSDWFRLIHISVENI